jgi:hypothetical protein
VAVAGHDRDTPPAEVDFSRPNCARVYDYLLGGKDNSAADRDLARRLLEADPGLRGKARRNRWFLSVACARAAGDGGIAQFLDLGCGFPVRPALHEAVRSVIPSARFAYADRDPVAAAHVRALQASGEGLAAAEGDLADPAAILADPAVRDVIDLSRPAGVVLGAVLHLWDAGRAEKIVQGYVSRVAAGSWVIVSAAWYRPEAAGTLAALRREYAPGVFFNHSPADVAGFLAGLQVAEPGIASAGRWVSGEGGTAGKPSTMLAAVGIKRLLSVTGLAYGDFPGSGEGRFSPR